VTDGIIDLSKPTGYFEVSVWHYSGDRNEVSTDRGLGRLGVYETDNLDKALGVAEYIESTGRYDCAGDGEFITNEGQPFGGSIVYWDCKEHHQHGEPS
jgi:hypothetical protein